MIRNIRSTEEQMGSMNPRFAVIPSRLHRGLFRLRGFPLRFCCFLLFLCCILPATARAQPSSPVPVIPRPQYVNPRPGTCILNGHARIVTDATFRNAAAQLGDLLGIPVHETTVSGAGTVISFEKSGRRMGDEGYTLLILPHHIRIEAATDAGAFYAVQTLRQMLPAVIERGSRFRAWRLRCVEIADLPRFPWRGVMLDCSRHFLPVPDIKRLIDRLAALKINRLHWHLTDDQGWRLEIKAYPELTRVGAWRQEGAARYGGYYSQEQVRDLVAYAAERHIVIVPEIDMPGHTSAALAAYPFLGCTGEKIDVPSEWGMHTTVMCVGRESTYAFIGQVLDEVTDLFPSPWIHVGGDECPWDQWSACDSCQAAITRHALPNIGHLQGTFTQRLEHMLSSRSRQLIGWNEILEGASQQSIIQGWYNVDISVNAAHRGHRVICSPTEPFYFNYHARANTLELVYNFDPLTARHWPADGEALLGVECCLWSEELRNAADVDNALFPRAAAFAEGAWTRPWRKDWEDFRFRIAACSGRWSMQDQRFERLDSITWDDGHPLMVHSQSEPVTGMMQLSLNAPADGKPKVMCASAAGAAAASTAAASTAASGVPDHRHAPRILRSDSTELLVEYGRTPWEDIPAYVLSGPVKQTNAWAEVLDSTSYDGLFHLTTTSVRPESHAMDIYPNPIIAGGASARINLRVSLPRPGAVEITIADSHGIPKLTDRIGGLSFGEQIISLPLPRLPSGTYFIIIRTPEGHMMKGFQIIDYR